MIGLETISGLEVTGMDTKPMIRRIGRRQIEIKHLPPGVGIYLTQTGMVLFRQPIMSIADALLV